MSTVTLAQLVSPPSVDDWRTSLLGFLGASDFPVTAWDPTGNARGLVEAEADALASLSKTIAAIASGGFLDYATGDWLTLLAKSVYGEDRKQGVVLIGSLLLANSTGAGIPINPYDLTVESDNLLTYQNTTGGTVPAGGTLPVTIVAGAPGTAYNVGNGSISTLLTPVPGLSVSNPAVGGTGTWIVTAGVDVESDTALATRCRAKWGTLGTGGTVDAFTSWALSSSSSVTRVKIQENTPSGGQVTVLVAGAAGAIVDAPTLAAIDAYIQLRRPLTVRVFTQSASNFNVRVIGTVTVQALQLTTAKAAVATALTNLFASLPIGATIPVSTVVSAIAAVPGVNEVALTNPSNVALRLGTDDWVMGATQIATFTNELLWNAV